MGNDLQCGVGGGIAAVFEREVPVGGIERPCIRGVADTRQGAESVFGQVRESVVVGVGCAEAT